jgi:hypothetical protein
MKENSFVEDIYVEKNNFQHNTRRMEKRNGRVGTFLRSESLQKVDKMTKHISEEKRTTVGLLKLLFKKKIWPNAFISLFGTQTIQIMSISVAAFLRMLSPKSTHGRDSNSVLLFLRGIPCHRATTPQGRLLYLPTYKDHIDGYHKPQSYYLTYG